VAAGRRRRLARELEGRVAFERRAYLLLPGEGQRPAYDDYVISHRKRAREMEPTLGFAIPEVGQPYPRSSLPAQCVAAAVIEHHPDLMDDLEDSLFRAMFVELRDISAADVLRDTARAAGVPEHLVEQALADPELRDRVFAEHSEGVEAGVTAIPALVIPGYAAVTGAVPLDPLRRAFEQVLAAPAPSQSA
jgi:predicted DsbA family dithiol-disulfide isomerase